MSTHTLRVTPINEVAVSAILLPLAGEDCAEALTLVADGGAMAVMHRESGTLLGYLPASHPVVRRRHPMTLTGASVSGDSYRALLAHLTVTVEVLAPAPVEGRGR